MKVFPSVYLETAHMGVGTLRTVLIFPRQSIWEVTCLGLLQKWTFSHLSPHKPHKCVLKPSEQGSFFQDDRFAGSHAQVYSKNEHFPSYLLGNCIYGCWNSHNRACFSKMIDLRGHMPRFTIKTINCHSWPLDVSSNVKLPFLTTRCL